MSNYIGIDYGLGQSNIDHATGIRYGVIPENEIGEAWYTESEPDYGEPHCLKCGNEAALTSEREYRTPPPGEYYCDSCEYFFDSEEAYPEESLGSTFENSEYSAISGQDGDIFVVKSPYYTHAQFCSPCAPGAGYLLNPVEGGPKSYCFGHEWFEGGKAPYPVYRVSDNQLVKE